MKKILSLLTMLFAFAAISIAPLTGCKTQKLEPGGPYAPTNAAGQAASEPDIAFFTVDSAFKLAHQTVSLVFEIELNNRSLLWKVSPNIKHALDELRPQVNDAVLKFAIARDVYKAHPTPTGLDTLQATLSKIQALASSAEAVLPKGN